MMGQGVPVVVDEGVDPRFPEAHYGHDAYAAGGVVHEARLYRVDPAKLGDVFHPLVRVALEELRIRSDHPLFKLCEPYLMTAGQPCGAYESCTRHTVLGRTEPVWVAGKGCPCIR